MKTAHIIAATAVMLIANGAVAADAPASGAALTTAALSAAAPAVKDAKRGTPTRAQVRAEAAEFVKNHKTALAVQLEQYK